MDSFLNILKVVGEVGGSRAIGPHHSGIRIDHEGFASRPHHIGIRVDRVVFASPRGGEELGPGSARVNVG